MCQFSHTTLTSAKEQGAWIQIDDEMSCSDKDKVKAPQKAKTDKSDNSNKEHAASAAATPDTSGGTQQKETEKLTPPLQPQRLPLTDGLPSPAETGQKSDAAEPLSPGTENFFLQGLEDALDAEVEKTSPPSKKVRREEPTRDLRQWMTKSTQPAEAAPNQPQPSPSQKGSGPVEPAAHVKTEAGSGCHSLQVKVKTEPTSPKQQLPAHSLPSQPQQAQQAEPAETQIQTPTQQHTLEANAGTCSTCEQPTKHEHAGLDHISKDTMDMETAAGEDTETVTAAPTITLAVAAAARHDESLAETQATHPSTPQDTSVMMPDSGNAKASDEPGDQTVTNGANIAVAAAATNLSQQLQQPQQTANTQIDMTSETMAKEETIDRVNLVSEKSEKQRNTDQDQEAFAEASESAEAEAAAAATAIATQQLPMPEPPVPTPVSVPAPVCEEVDPNRSTSPIHPVHPVNSQTSGAVETSAEAVAEASASAATSPSAHSHAQGESEPKAEAEVAEPVAEMTATATGRTNTTSQPATPPPTKPPSTPAHLQIPIPAPTTPAPSVASSNRNRKKVDSLSESMLFWEDCLHELDQTEEEMDRLFENWDIDSLSTAFSGDLVYCIITINWHCYRPGPTSFIIGQDPIKFMCFSESVVSEFRIRNHRNP